MIISKGYLNSHNFDSLWFDNENKLIKIKSIIKNYDLFNPYYKEPLVNLYGATLYYYFYEFSSTQFQKEYPKAKSTTQTFDYDSKGNWITSKLYADNKMVKIYKREISYWD